VNNTAKYTPPAEDEEFLPVAAIARAVRRRLWLVILFLLLTAGIAEGVSLLQPPVYEASATVVVSPAQGANPQESFSNSVTGLQALAHEMEVAGLTPSMVEEVVRTQAEGRTLSASDLQNNLTVEQDQDTRFIVLTYRDNDPTKTQAIANLAAEVFARQIPEASGVATDVEVTVTSYATVPKTPEEPDPLRNGLVALAIGLMLGIGVAFLLELFEGSGQYSPDEVERDLGVPTFGAIPDFDKAQHKPHLSKRGVHRDAWPRL
jgi:capsular polysaccharide biosynthesis protein